MSALFNFHSFLTVVLLGICACTYVKIQFPALLEQRTGFRGVFWKAARIARFSDNSDREAEMITFDGKVVHGSTFFRYLGSIIQKDGELDGDVAHRIKAGWLKWKSATWVLCDPDMPHRLKGKFYRTAIRPALLYGTECWAVKQCHVQKMNVAEMRMLRWMCGHTKKDRLRNEVIREKVRVASIEDKMMENRLRWFGHVRRRPVDAPVRRLESWGQVILSKVEADRRKLG
ncbi:hypothetical protein OROHE_004986 [Orobanche hederae]